MYIYMYIYTYTAYSIHVQYIFICVPFRSVFRSINFVSISFLFPLVTRFAWQTIYALCAFTVKKNKVMIYL